MPLILASTSRYRRDLLERLGLPFHVARPDVDESALPDEPPVALAQRLARAKAQVIAGQHPESWVLGSDQVAVLGMSILGKPGTRDRAIAQLHAMSGQRVGFHTAVCLLRGDTRLQETDSTWVSFRELQGAEIVRYVDAEQALDCAGSFKSEGLGICLFETVQTGDPTALIGLPLIAVSRMLRQAGFTLP